MPTTYVMGDDATYNQLVDDIRVSCMVDIDVEYPYSEYFLGDKMRKWVRTITQCYMHK